MNTLIAPDLDALSRPIGLRAAQVALFLDFDGTLVELAERPELVTVPPGLPSMLTRLEHRLGGALAIVTGRSLDVVDAFLAPARLPTAAAHGTEGRAAGGASFGPSARDSEAVERIVERLAPLVAREPRLLLEKKAGAASLHFRQAPELEALCREAMDTAITGEMGFEVVDGKCVLEARPAGIDKGTAILRLMQQPPFRGRLPVFFGDDRTDEDGFDAMRTVGGIAVKVGRGATSAAYRIPSVSGVLQLLARLSEADMPAEDLAGHFAATTKEARV